MAYYQARGAASNSPLVLEPFISFFAILGRCYYRIIFDDRRTNFIIAFLLSKG